MPGESELGDLYRLETDGTATTVVEDVDIPNEMGFSHSLETFFFTESEANAVYAFDDDIRAYNPRIESGVVVLEFDHVRCAEHRLGEVLVEPVVADAVDGAGDADRSDTPIRVVGDRCRDTP